MRMITPFHCQPLGFFCLVHCPLFLLLGVLSASTPEEEVDYQRFSQFFKDKTDRQQELIQGSGDIELSIVNAAPVCGQEEDDSPYSEIRHSQFIGGANAEGVCINTDSCLLHKCYSDKHHNTSEKQNIYQMSIDKNEYDHVILKVKSSDMLSDRNLSLSHSNIEEYASVLNKQSLGKEIRPNDGLKCQNLTLPINTTTNCNDMGKNESKHNCLLTEYNQRIQFEMEVKVDISDKTKHNSEYTGRQIGSMSDNRPYSMAGCLSENNLNETVDESLNLPNINISKNLHLSVNDLSKVVENSVNPLDIDISGRRENASKRENNSQTNARPHSFVKIPEL